MPEGGNHHPTQIGRYRIDRILGAGTMGVVYLARGPAQDRPVALKLIRADLLGDRDRGRYLQRFADEVRAVILLKNTNIIPIYDISLHNGNPFLVMEYVRGESLRQAIGRHGRFSIPAVVEVMLQVLEALGAAHAGGVVHRDVKPANVMIGPDQFVKVVDFGIAPFDNSILTQAGAVIGTPGYMSPEQILGEAVDARADLFSAGVILHEMLIGTPPFEGDSTVATIHGILNAEPPNLSANDSSIPPEVAAVVAQALAKDPAERFQTAQAMVDALRQWISTPAPEAPTIQVRTPEMVTLSSNEIQRAERALAMAIGPIAKIVVKRAVPTARSSEDFWLVLAKQIQTDDDRRAFLRCQLDLG